MLTTPHPPRGYPGVNFSADTVGQSTRELMLWTASFLRVRLLSSHLTPPPHPPPPPPPGLEPDLGAHVPGSPECLERAQSPFPMPAGALLTCPGRWGWWQLFCPPLPGRQGTPGILVVPGLSVCPAFGPTPSCLKGERACRLFLTSFISPAWCRVIVCPPLTLLSV